MNRETFFFIINECNSPYYQVRILTNTPKIASNNEFVQIIYNQPIRYTTKGNSTIIVRYHENDFILLLNQQKKTPNILL